MATCIDWGPFCFRWGDDSSGNANGWALDKANCRVRCLGRSGATLRTVRCLGRSGATLRTVRCLGRSGATLRTVRCLGRSGATLRTVRTMGPIKAALWLWISEYFGTNYKILVVI